MSIRIIKKMPSAEDIINSIPISDAGQKKVEQDRQEIRDILSGKDGRLLMIVGPCSAWPSDAVFEYATCLKKVSDELQGKLKIVMRVYIQKPRTVRGWLGPVNQPDPYEAPDIEAGVSYCRSMMVRIIEMGLPIADEALFTHNAKGFAELLSWIAIGARSVEDQEHRIFASGLDCPVGMKNGTSGSIEVAINAIIAAQHGHTTVLDGYQVETAGNPYAHLVLRGGASGPNYGVEHVHKVKALFEKFKVANPAILIDASHDNCRINGGKDASVQPIVVKEVLATMRVHPDCSHLVKGFMVESFLKEGNQKPESATKESVDRGGLSITDPCLGWEATEELLRYVAHES